MDPLNEKELNSLLRRWTAPETPAGLRGKVLPRRTWWQWLLKGTIRIPVPVGVAAVAILIVWLLYSRPVPVPVPQPAATNTLADFQPVRQLEPKVIGKSHETNDSQGK